MSVYLKPGGAVQKGQPLFAQYIEMRQTNQKLLAWIEKIVQTIPQKIPTNPEQD